MTMSVEQSPRIIPFVVRIPIVMSALTACSSKMINPMSISNSSQPSTALGSCPMRTTPPAKNLGEWGPQVPAFDKVELLPNVGPADKPLFVSHSLP